MRQQPRDPRRRRAPDAAHLGTKIWRQHHRQAWRHAVLDRAAKAGIERVVCIGIDRESSIASIEIAKRFLAPKAVEGAGPGAEGKIILEAFKPGTSPPDSFASASVAESGAPSFTPDVERSVFTGRGLQ